ncbi:hypothetical protein Q4578_06805 [Shimia thalassica]|uniref:hypothetical protein n=1 Tax=Shimia thalassica TaxID=1715693 RepID=UPI0026E2A683|nr:hypothetical protein [Shimia thalassica]MDO6521289.1 hypothetical protein [Shimia thalassica]
MTIADTTSDARKTVMDTVREKREQIAADNARNKAERNARRYKAERDPDEYEKQKKDQKAEYADMIAETEGREVRAYVVVPGETRSEKDQNARQRHAEKERKRWANASQEQKDKKNDKVWCSRKGKAGWSEERIALELAKRQEARRHRQPEPGPYEDNPNYGAF